MNTVLLVVLVATPFSVPLAMLLYGLFGVGGRK